MTTDRRVRLAVIAYACLLAQVSTLAHRVLVQHITCAEHGEAVHLHGGTSAGVGLSSLADDGLARRFEHSVSRASPVPVATNDDHDHCSIAASRTLTPRSVLDGALRLVPCQRRVDAPSGVAVGWSIATYLIAPKTSPPRRA